MSERPQFLDVLADQLSDGADRLDERRRRVRRAGAVGVSSVAVVAIAVGLWALADTDRSGVVAAIDDATDVDADVDRADPDADLDLDLDLDRADAVTEPGPELDVEDRDIRPPGPLEARSVATEVVGDGTTITRIEASDGSVFALRLPESFGRSFEVVDGSGPDGLVTVRGEGMEARIEVGFCRLDPLSDNALGLAVGPVRLSDPPPTLGFCRPDEFLQLVIDPVPDVAIDLDADLDRFDLVPVSFGRRYTRWVMQTSPDLQQCCFEDRGPMWFGDILLVSDGTGSGQVSALDPVTLVPIWTTDLVAALGGDVSEVGDGSLLLAVTESGTVVATTGFGHVVGLDAGTGAVRWTVGLAEETPIGTTMSPDGQMIVASDVTWEGDLRAPTIRSIDVEAGRVVWSAAGEPGTSLQWTDPVVMNRLVLVADVPSWDEAEGGAPTASVLAFDLATGDRVWTAPLDGPSNAYASFPMILTDAQRDLLLVQNASGGLFRLEPATGTRRWSADPGIGPMIGLSPATVTLSVQGREVDVDLETGELVD